MDNSASHASPQAAVKSKYDIDVDSIMHQAAEHIEVTKIGAAQTPWWNRTLCAVNDTWVRLGVMEGDFHWHQHDDTDEFFLVLEGQLDIELPGGRVLSLKPGEACTVPRGMPHFPQSRGRSVVLMVERAGFSPTGTP